MSFFNFKLCLFQTSIVNSRVSLGTEQSTTQFSGRSLWATKNEEKKLQAVWTRAELGLKTQPQMLRSPSAVVLL